MKMFLTAGPKQSSQWHGCPSPGSRKEDRQTVNGEKRRVFSEQGAAVAPLPRHGLDPTGVDRKWEMCPIETREHLSQCQQSFPLTPNSQKNKVESVIGEQRVPENSH